MTERKALTLLRRRSEDALGWFIQQYTPYVVTIIDRIIGAYMDPADIEEVAADVFFTLWENAAQVHSVKGYLGTVARNKAKNKLREISADLPLMDHILVLDELGLQERIEEKELASAVRRAVMAMPHPDREIFLRFYYHYQSLEEISAEMGINLSSVKSKLRRGRQKLKASLLRYLT